MWTCGKHDKPQYITLVHTEAVPSRSPNNCQNLLRIRERYVSYL